jgi:hypothetical protein
VDAAPGRIDTLDVMGFGYGSSRRCGIAFELRFPHPAAAGTDVF